MKTTLTLFALLICNICFGQNSIAATDYEYQSTEEVEETNSSIKQTAPAPTLLQTKLNDLHDHYLTTKSGARNKKGNDAAHFTVGYGGGNSIYAGPTGNDKLEKNSIIIIKEVKHELTTVETIEFYQNEILLGKLMIEEKNLKLVYSGKNSKVTLAAIRDFVVIKEYIQNKKAFYAPITQVSPVKSDYKQMQ